MTEPVSPRWKKAWQNIPEHIKTFGCTVLAIAPEKGSPGFSYTVGLHEQGFPELLTIGLPAVTAHHILMSAYTRMKSSGEVPKDGDILADVCNSPLIWKKVAPGNDMTLWAFDYYPNDEVEVMQIVWPDRAGLFPWQDGHDEQMEQAVVYDLAA